MLTDQLTEGRCTLCELGTPTQQRRRWRPRSERALSRISERRRVNTAEAADAARQACGGSEARMTWLLEGSRQEARVHQLYDNVLASAMLRCAAPARARRPNRRRRRMLLFLQRSSQLLVRLHGAHRSFGALNLLQAGACGRRAGQRRHEPPRFGRRRSGGARQLEARGGAHARRCLRLRLLDAAQTRAACAARREGYGCAPGFGRRSALAG